MEEINSKLSVQQKEPKVKTKITPSPQLVLDAKKMEEMQQTKFNNDFLIDKLQNEVERLKENSEEELQKIKEWKAEIEKYVSESLNDMAD